MALQIISAASLWASHLAGGSNGSGPPAGMLAGHLKDATDAPPRILVVDDDDAVRAFAVDFLMSLGYPVASANGGMSAMRLVSETPSLDLVFTDIVMPGLSGIVLADMVKKRRPELKILYATGYRDIAAAEAEAGVIHGKILEKPYRPSELEIEVQHLLSH